MALASGTRLGPNEVTAQIGVPYPWSKRLTDVVCSGLALIKLSGLALPEDRGPVLRSETRYSAGQPFRCYKFRIIKQGVLQREPPIGSVVGAKIIEQDGNCTAVGRWLKRWYLDELPQLYHIWRGEMSVVGPRLFRSTLSSTAPGLRSCLRCSRGPPLDRCHAANHRHWPRRPHRGRQ